MSVGEQANVIKDRGTPRSPVTGLRPTPFNYSIENEDPLAGFAMAVNNGQIRLALEYAVRALNILSERISALEGDVPVVMSPTEETAPLTASTPKKATRTAPTGEKAESPES